APAGCYVAQCGGCTTCGSSVVPTVCKDANKQLGSCTSGCGVVKCKNAAGEPITCPSYLTAPSPSGGAGGPCGAGGTTGAGGAGGTSGSGTGGTTGGGLGCNPSGAPCAMPGQADYTCCNGWCDDGSLTGIAGGCL